MRMTQLIAAFAHLSVLVKDAVQVRTQVHPFGCRELQRKPLTSPAPPESGRILGRCGRARRSDGTRSPRRGSGVCFPRLCAGGGTPSKAVSDRPGHGPVQTRSVRCNIEKLIAELGLSVVKDIVGIPRAYVLRVGPQAKENPIKIANRLAADPNVVASEPSVAIASKSSYVPADTLFQEQWHLPNNGGPLLSTAAHIDAVRVWDLFRGERSVIVAVADDSCDLHHTDFRGPGKLVAPRDFAGQDFEPLPELEDDNHGTACYGVAVAEETGSGVVGVAAGCALMPIRTSGFIDDASIEDLCE